MKRDQIESARFLDYVEAVVDRPRLVLVRAEFLVHARVPVGSTTACWCCGSTTAHIVERIPDQLLLIDRVTGYRVHEDEAASREAFDGLAATAMVVPLYWRCTVHTLPLLREGDDPKKRRKVIVALGGSRSSKTQTGVQWLLRRWMRRGGARRSFWFVAPELAQAMIAVKKLVTGEDDDQPILPVDDDGNQILALSWPKSDRAADHAVTLLDGTRIEMKHAANRGGRGAKGFSVRDVLIDETCEIRDPVSFGIIKSRTTGSGGAVYCATTPVPGHYLKPQYIDKAERDDGDGKLVGNPLFVCYSLDKRHNVWFSEEFIAEDLASMASEAERKREGEGLWIEDGVGSLYLEFDPKRHVSYVPHWSLDDIGLGGADVTGAAVRRLFPGDSPFVIGRRPATTRYIGGSDVNVTPFVTVLGQVERLDPDDPHNSAKWRLWIWDEVVSRQTTSVRQAELIQSDERANKLMGLSVSPYRGAAVLIDPSACHSDPTAKRIAKAKENSRSTCAAGAMTEAGLDVRPCHLSEDGKPLNPRIRDRVNLVHQLQREGRLMIHNRCTEVLRSLKNQQDDGTGKPVKEPGEASDRLSAAADAVGYLAWGLFAYKPRRQGAGFTSGVRST